MNARQDKILGGLLAAAVGDALGAATETRSTQQIKERFGGLVRGFVDHPEDNLSRGSKPGLVTDDFSISYFTAKEMITAKSGITQEIAERALLRWFDCPQYTAFIGPTTRKSINGIKRIENPHPVLNVFDRLLCDNTRTTNGGGMKSGLMGLFNPSDIEGAIEDAIVMCLPTHDNPIALSGACAIAAATARAFDKNISYIEIIEAGIYGARQGFIRTKQRTRPVAGASVEKKIQLAVEYGLRLQDDFDCAMQRIADVIGGGLFAYEAIPAVFGHIAACKGRLNDSILMGVNGGDDTDTVACMTGYIVGVLHGSLEIKASYLDVINKENNFDLVQMTMDIDTLNTMRGK